MKHLFLLVLILSGFQIFAQNNNTGFSYQAVIRDADGQAMSSTKIDITIELYTKDLADALFVESHQTKTDKYGQINLIVGQGTQIQGLLSEIPWETGNIFYKIRMTDKKTKLDIISEAQLLAVPYAMHANTANSLKNDDETGTVRGPLDESKYWTVVGNTIFEDTQNIGSINRSGIDIITFNETRIEIKDSGEVSIKEDMTAESNALFQGQVRFADRVEFQDGATFKEQVVFEKPVSLYDDLDVGGTLTVKGSGQFEGSISSLGNLTIFGTSNIYGNTTLNQNLTVGGNTTLVEDVEVGGNTILNRDLNVVQNTILDLDLNVGGNTQLDQNLDVGGDTKLDQALTVDGAALFNGGITAAGDMAIGGMLSVEGATTINNTLQVEKDVPDGGYVASFTNTNSGNGDGINIKLGKNRTIYTPPSIPSPLTAGQIQDIKNLIRCDYTGPKVTLLGEIVLEGLQADVEMIAGLAVGTFNMFTGFLNNKLGLPLDFPDIPILAKTTVFPGVHIDIAVLEYDLDAIEIGPLDIDGFNLIPSIPNLSLGFLGIDAIPINSLEFWGIPNLCLNDTPGSNPLNNENEFVRFSDASNNKMGSIRAVSLTDWSNNYLTPSYLFKLHGAITSAVDKKHGRYHFKGELTKALEDYKNIGVEYSSGNGDYAEWLERVETEEMISAGDIVGVIGGKITRDVTNAEQVMVVSHSPIVLGNVPPAEKNYMGNNIAFMGQVPVKVMGPVTTGDYIVASADIPGYGIAKSQEEMTIDDFKNAVGRSWDNVSSEGPNLVNTVVGIHNGDYSKLLKKMNDKLNETDARFDTLESKVEVLSKIITQTSSL